MKRVALIGGGISGLAALHFLRHRYGDSVETVLYEKDQRLGGTIGTDHKDGFISEWGPNGFLDKEPLTRQLVEEIGLTDQLDPANSSAEKRFIFHADRLHAIQAHPLKFLLSGILSLRGRARLVAEPFISQKTDGKDETIFDFAQRRIGREAAENMIVPMVSGIYGGNARELSLRACFPIMETMEREHGSLVKALIARKKAGSSGGPAGPSGRLTSFKAGLFQLIEGLQEKYREHIITGREVIGVENANGRFRVSFTSLEPELFDAVVCAAPAFAGAEMVKGLDGGLADLLASIPYSSIAVVCLGYPREAIARDLTGFGFLIPRNEGKRILGSIWTSSIFSDRSPTGMVQLRTMIGGATDPDATELNDEQLTKIVHGELAAILGIDRGPDGDPAWQYANIFRWSRGIPQFVMGHPEKVARLDRFQKTYPGLFFTGNAYDGIGLNDCIVRSDKVVTQLAERFELSP